MVWYAAIHYVVLCYREVYYMLITIVDVVPYELSYCFLSFFGLVDILPLCECDIVLYRLNIM